MEFKDIGARIKDARKTKGLTQAALGHPLGMSRATISGIETGKINEVGLRKVMLLCASLDLAISVGQRHPYPTLQELRREHDAKKRA